VIFKNSIRKELSQSFVTSLFILLTVVISNMLIQTLGQASKGVINPTDVLVVLFLTLLGYSGTLLTLSLFIATISTLSRMFRDSEMVIWFSSGQSLMSLIRPIMRFAWPILLCILVSTFFIWPWSHRQQLEMQSVFESRNDIERLVPGVFQEFSGGTLVVFIDKDSPSQQSGRNVFVSRTDGEWQSTISAKEGKIKLIQNEKFLSLFDGQQLSINTRSQESRLVDFKEYELLISDRAASTVFNKPIYTVNSLELLLNRNSHGDGELFWRLSQFFCAFNLIILAIALSTVNTRAASSYQTAQALLVFVIYYNSINIVQRWIAEASIPLVYSLLVLHGITSITAIFWIKTKQRK